VPLLYGGKFWGLLAIHQCSGPRQWQQLEIELLKQLATQLSIAIQQSELYQQVVELNTNLENQVKERTKELQQSLDYEAILKRISDDVRDSLDEHQILQVAVWELAVALNIDGCDSALYNTSAATATISYEYTTSLPTSQGKVIKMTDFQDGYNQLLQGQYFQFAN
jgi:GAF domain-containing protein